MVGFMSRSRRTRRVGGEGAVQVFVADEQSGVAVDIERWRHLAHEVLLAEGVRGAAELSLIFVDETTITEMNRVHMGKDAPTDVLAFPIDAVVIDDSPGPGRVSRGPDRGVPDSDDYPLLLGDVVVCPVVAARQAPTHAGNFDDEVALLVTHGVLHVLGYDHADDDERIAMRTRETSLLEALHWRGPAPSGFRIEHADESPETRSGDLT